MMKKNKMNLEEENRKLKSDLEQFSEAYKKYRDYEKEELADSCYDLERENQKLKEKNKKLNITIENAKIEQKSAREHIEELEEENKKLKEERDEYKERWGRSFSA